MTGCQPTLEEIRAHSEQIRKDRAAFKEANGLSKKTKRNTIAKKRKKALDKYQDILELRKFKDDFEL